MSRFSKLAKVFLVLLVLYLVLELWTKAVGPARGPDVKLLTNRVWVDRLPKGPRDLVTHLALVSVPRIHKGAVGRVSAYRLNADVVTYQVEGDALTLALPQEQKKVTMRAKVFECKGKAPRPFDLCLELSHAGRVLKLYSRSGGAAEGPVYALAAAEGDEPASVEPVGVEVGLDALFADDAGLGSPAE